MKFEQLLFYWKEIGKGAVNFRDICDEGTNKEDFLKGFKMVAFLLKCIED